MTHAAKRAWQRRSTAENGRGKPKFEAQGAAASSSHHLRWACGSLLSWRGGDAQKMTEFWDKFDRVLIKMHLMHPLTQFDRYLHRHTLEHTHLDPNTIVRKYLPKDERGK